MRNRLPNLPSLLQVYAVIAVMLAAWTILAFLWKLPAWLLLLNLGEVLTVFAYAMTANLIESLVILMLLLAACILLPARVLRDDFLVRGTILSMGLIGSLIAFVGAEMQLGMQGGLLIVLAPLAVLSAMIFLLGRLRDYARLRSLALGLSDRLTVFLFILLPVFGIAAMYVIVRNLV